MIKHNIFKDDVRHAIDAVKDQFFRDEYFVSQYEWCRELLLGRQDVKTAAFVIGLGMEYATLCGLDSAMLALVYMDRMIPDALEHLMKDGFSREEAEENLQDIEIWVQVYGRCRNGAVGLDRLNWVLRSVAGTVKRFGSLQFEETTYDFPYFILYHAERREYRAFAQAGAAVDQDGYLCGTNGRVCTEKIVTSLNLKDGRIEGYEVDLRKGTVITGGPSGLILDGWTMLLIPGRKVIAVHVPEGADISEHKMNLSMDRALEYYGGRSDAADGLFICDSWLLDPHLTEIAEKGSRVCRFMERFYKLPVYAKVPQIYERVLGFDYVPGKIESVLCETSLQRSLKAYLLEGKEVFTTAGFMIYKQK